MDPDVGANGGDPGPPAIRPDMEGGPVASGVPAPGRPAGAPGGAVDPAAVHLSRQELAAVSDELASFFPQPFDETRVVLMVVDPHHVHACWHICLDHLDATRAQIGPEGAHAPIVVRFYDITFIDFSRQPAHRSFDIQVHGLQNNWYVEVWEDSKSYVADIGLRKPDGTLMAIARSNVVHTPRSAESPHYERAGVVMETDGTLRRVPDFVQGGIMPGDPRRPTPQMPREESDSLVREGYRQLMRSGRPECQQAPLPGLKRRDGEF